VSDETEPPPAPDWDAPEPPYQAAVDDAPEAAAPGQSHVADLALPPTSRYPDGRPSPGDLPDAEVWHGIPDPPAPGPTLRKRLWWVLPFGGSLLAGAAFVAAVAVLTSSSLAADALGKTCFVVTVVAVVAALLVGPSVRWALTPVSRFFWRGYVSAPIVTVCILLFAVAPTLTWILLAAR
jgi:hypothetical protein